MLADESCRSEILTLVRETYARLSTPGSNPAELMAHQDMTLAGSELGELVYGSKGVQELVTRAAEWGFTWTAETVTVWREGEVAWAQILGSVHMTRDGKNEIVPYWNTGVFARKSNTWQWRYWGGSEPKESAKV